MTREERRLYDWLKETDDPIARYIRDLGTFYAIPSPRFDPAFDTPFGRVEGIPAACWGNAQGWAAPGVAVGPQGPTRIWYVEGYALDRINIYGIPMHHGWCIDANGLVIDPTPGWWDNGVAYFGVAIDMKEERAARRGRMQRRGGIPVLPVLRSLGVPLESVVASDAVGGTT